MRKIIFKPQAAEQFIYWSRTDRKIFDRLIKLIEETVKFPFEGTGKPEPLKHKLSGYWVDSS
jgi:toxin YoeB